MIVRVLCSFCAVVAFVNAQIPSFGACPDYSAIDNFERTRFLGNWFEIERYFTISEVATKCVSVSYDLEPDGNIYVKNSFTNRL